MAAERVVIDIEVNSDIATIEATREAVSYTHLTLPTSDLV